MMQDSNFISKPLVLRAEDLALSYGQNSFKVFSQVNFCLESGKCLWISGPNACGKTSLLRSLSGQIEPSFGRVLWNEQDLEYDPRLRKNFSYNLEIPPFMESSDRVVKYWQQIYGLDPELLYHYLQSWGLSWNRASPLAQLSKGQLQSLSLALSLTLKRPAIFWDEPFNFLSPKIISLIMLDMKKALGDGALCFISSHQPLGDTISYQSLVYDANRSSFVLC